eukprot:gene22387-1033_t
MTKEERAEANDALPPRCDPQWYRTAFLVPDCPADLVATDDVIGISSDLNGVRDCTRASELLHDLMALAFGGDTGGSQLFSPTLSSM